MITGAPRVLATCLNLFLVGSVLIGASDADISPAGLKFPFDSRGAIIVSGSVNGSAPLRFLLDTGSSRSLISDAVGGRLGLHPVARSLVVSVAGQEMAMVVRLDRLAFGPTVRSNTLVLMLPEARLRDLVPNVDGIIGQDVLVDLDYTVDYRRRELRWDPPRIGWADPGATPPAASGGRRLRLIEDEGRLLVELPQNREGCDRLLLVPDSSASDIVLDRRWVQALGLRRTAATTQLESVSGRRSGTVMLLPALRVGDLTLHDRLVVVVDRPAEEAVRADGLLPLHLFSSVRFTARDRWLTVN